MPLQLPAIEQPLEYKIASSSTHSHSSHPYQPRIGHRDFVSISPGDSFSLPVIEGSGSLTTIWMTLIPGASSLIRFNKMWTLEKARIKIYTDKRTDPDVNSPIGDFFGSGAGHYVNLISTPVGMAGGGFYCYFPMPFKKEIRVTIENQNQKDPIKLFYSNITAKVATGDYEPELRFKAEFREKKFGKSGKVFGEKIPYDPYTVFDHNGNGMYIGTVMTLTNKQRLLRKLRLKYPFFASLEGNVKFYIDEKGDEVIPSRISKPVDSSKGKQSIEYTGIEDYFNGGWYFRKGCFQGPLHGLTYKSWRKSKISAYRFHTNEPIPWEKNIRVTAHHGEFDDVNSEIRSVSYYYERT